MMTAAMVEEGTLRSTLVDADAATMVAGATLRAKLPSTPPRAPPGEHPLPAVQRRPSEVEMPSATMVANEDYGGPALGRSRLSFARRSTVTKSQHDRKGLTRAERSPSQHDNQDTSKKRPSFFRIRNSVHNMLRVVGLRQRFSSDAAAKAVSFSHSSMPPDYCASPMPPTPEPVPSLPNESRTHTIRDAETGSVWGVATAMGPLASGVVLDLCEDEHVDAETRAHWHLTRARESTSPDQLTARSVFRQAQSGGPIHEISSKPLRARQLSFERRAKATKEEQVHVIASQLVSHVIATACADETQRVAAEAEAAEAQTVRLELERLQRARIEHERLQRERIDHEHLEQLASEAERLKNQKLLDTVRPLSCQGGSRRHTPPHTHTCTCVIHVHALTHTCTGDAA